MYKYLFFEHQYNLDSRYFKYFDILKDRIEMKLTPNFASMTMIFNMCKSNRLIYLLYVINILYVPGRG